MSLHVLLAAAAALLAPPAAVADAGCTARSEAFVPIEGIEQWLTISGDDCRNPAVLFLHGGPGNPLSPYSNALYGGWEDKFTIVQWDQRGAGRTFSHNPGSADQRLTIEQMTKDGIAVTEHVRRRLGKEKVILVGGSWGSVLGVHMARARPDLFTAYVGIGQLVSHQTNQSASYRRLLDLARKAGDADTLARIEALGAPPWSNPRNFGILRRATRKFEAKVTAPAPGHWWKPAAPYATPEALAAYEAGEDFSYIQFVGMSGDGMLASVDLPRLGTDFALPVYLIQGAEDLVTMPEVAKSYFDSIRAPGKEFILLPQTGHDPNRAVVDALRMVLDKLAR